MAETRQVADRAAASRAAASRAAASRLNAGSRLFAGLNRKWHAPARERHPDWSAIPDEVYRTLVGATAELARSLVYAGRTEALPNLEEMLVSLHLAVLAGRTWPPEPGGTWPPEPGAWSPAPGGAWPPEPGGAWPPDRKS